MIWYVMLLYCHSPRRSYGTTRRQYFPLPSIPSFSLSYLLLIYYIHVLGVSYSWSLCWPTLPPFYGLSGIGCLSRSFHSCIFIYIYFLNNCFNYPYGQKEAEYTFPYITTFTITRNTTLQQACGRSNIGDGCGHDPIKDPIHTEYTPGYMWW